MMSASHKSKLRSNNKKPPPRPPPPNFSKYKSKSTYHINQQTDNLIEWSPPNSPKTERSHNFGGSASSSFSSSTSSLASSKKSFEYDPVANNIWPLTNGNETGNHVNYKKQPTIPTYQTSGSNIGASSRNVGSSTFYQPLSTINGKANGGSLTVPSIFGPTIIRAQPPKKPPLPKVKPQVKQYSMLPMPSVPPPSPPKSNSDIETPYGIALYDFPATYPTDLPLQAGDVVILLRRINSEWFYGQLIDKEGMFPANFIDIKVPLKGEECMVTALFDFEPQMPEDLRLKTGQSVKVTRKISNDWLYGEVDGRSGQFPSNFVNRIPDNFR